MDGTEVGNSWNIEHLRKFYLSKISKSYRGNIVVGVSKPGGPWCNTPGVTMARAHLDTKGYDHMWENLRSKSMRALES
jgi:hypothetical protein